MRGSKPATVFLNFKFQTGKIHVFRIGWKQTYLLQDYTASTYIDWCKGPCSKLISTYRFVQNPWKAKSCYLLTNCTCIFNLDSRFSFPILIRLCSISHDLTKRVWKTKHHSCPNRRTFLTCSIDFSEECKHTLNYFTELKSFAVSFWTFFFRNRCLESDHHHCPHFI